MVSFGVHILGKVCLAAGCQLCKQAVALHTATGVGQPPSHQGTLLAIEGIMD